MSGLFGCQSNQLETYTGEVGGLAVELTHPAEWVVEQGDNAVYLASDEAIVGEETAVTAGARLRISTLPTSALATDNYPLLMQNEILAIQEVFLAEIEGDDFDTITINGNEAYSATLSSITSPVMYRFVMAPTENNIGLVLAEYVPEAEAEVEDEDSWATAIDEIINSLVLSAVTE